MHRIALLFPAFAALLLAPAPARAQNAGAFGLGFGLALGTRTGFELTAKYMVLDHVAVTCKLASIPHVGGASCGTDLYVLPHQDWYLTAEVGILSTFGSRPAPGDSAGARRGLAFHEALFVNLGAGVERETVLEEGEDDDEAGADVPFVSGYETYTFGPSLLVAARESGGGETTRWRPLRRPLFFADATAVLWLNRCGRC